MTTEVLYGEQLDLFAARVHAAVLMFRLQRRDLIAARVRHRKARPCC